MRARRVRVVAARADGCRAHLPAGYRHIEAVQEVEFANDAVDPQDQQHPAEQDEQVRAVGGQLQRRYHVVPVHACARRDSKTFQVKRESLID